MVDNLTKEDRRKAMSRVKSRGTKLEERVCKALWRSGIRFRKNVKDLFGKPDIAIKKRRVVVFIDSCFWHGCPQHCRLPASNSDYWKAKIERNAKRDNIVTDYYKEAGWKVLRIWEHDLKSKFEETIEMLKSALSE